ncbi:MAG: SDR family NAD(P)-dependent oxidoreductase [Acidimicrobiales bacterium]
MSAARRVAVVTGGASGIGRATAERLAADGFALAVLDMDGDGAARAVKAAGEDGLGLEADVSDEGSVDRAFARILSELGPVDVLVNNAGVTGGPAATTCHETPVEAWDQVFGVNVRGLFLCTRAALPVMLERGSGHVITVASAAGFVAFPGRCAYTASKGAAVLFTKSLAVDYAASGIRANAVCPGMAETPMTRWRLDVPELRARIEAGIPMGRVAQPEEIADAVALLASDRLAYMTGHALVLDGGWTAL